MSDVSINDMWKKWYGPPLVILFCIIAIPILWINTKIKRLKGKRTNEQEGG